MVDQTLLAAIADAGEIQPDDVVLEVGPGVGNLTRQLAQRAAAVLAVDIDRKLMSAAKCHHADLANVHWLHADVLAGKHAVEPAVLDQLRSLCEAHPKGRLRLVSNLPYNAASPLIAELLVQMCRESHTSPCESPAEPGANGRSLFFTRLAFTVQYEVALRMSAQPGSRDYGPLGILIQALSAPAPDGIQIVRKIPPGAFWPPPKIYSALVVINPDPARIQNLRDVQALQILLSGIFSHRRQTLANALKHHFAARWTSELKAALAAHFDLARRPETFSVEDFLRLDALLAHLRHTCILPAKWVPTGPI
ncbi:MAG: methyltransferase domain-containing protein [Phycisphaerales bacterium]|nr:methyltransferase domain-containing protein [Phycisphaerales bacterium]